MMDVEVLFFLCLAFLSIAWWGWMVTTNTFSGSVLGRRGGSDCFFAAWLACDCVFVVLSFLMGWGERG